MTAHAYGAAANATPAPAAITAVMTTSTMSVDSGFLCRGGAVTALRTEERCDGDATGGAGEGRRVVAGGAARWADATWTGAVWPGGRAGAVGAGRGGRGGGFGDGGLGAGGRGAGGRGAGGLAGVGRSHRPGPMWTRTCTTCRTPRSTHSGHPRRTRRLSAPESAVSGRG